MPEPIAIVAADTHLRTHIQNREGDAEHAFSQICDLGTLYDVPVIVAGDFLDKRKNGAEIIDFVTTQLDGLEEANVDFYFIQGQHELQPVPWLSAVHNLPQSLDVKTKGQGWMLGKHRLAGLDWRPAGKVKEGLELVADPDILVMHQVTQEFMGGIAAHELEFSWIPKSVKLLIIGDYHVHRADKFRNAGGKAFTVLSPGSTCMQAINESGDKFVYLLMDDLSYTSMPLQSREVIRIESIMLEEELDAFVETIGTRLTQAYASAKKRGLPPSLHRPILDLPYNENLTNAYSIMSVAIADRAHVNWQVICDAEEEEQSLSKAARQSAVAKGLLGCLPLVMDEEENPEAFMLANRLLCSQDKAEELAAVREEYFAD